MSPKERGGPPEAGERMIHIRLKADTHRRLRVHVAEGLLGREEVRRCLKPSDIDRIRTEVIDRLVRAERDGMEQRKEVRALVEAALGATGIAAHQVVSAVAAILSEAVRGRPGEGR